MLTLTDYNGYVGSTYEVTKRRVCFIEQVLSLIYVGILHNRIVLYVHGNNVITDVTINDGDWHFICATWTSHLGRYEIFIDGLLRDAGLDLSAGLMIEANGTIIVGQEQDSIGGSFSDSESFVGRIAFMDLWDHPITTAQISDHFSTCSTYHGNLVPWTDFKLRTHGSVKVFHHFLLFFVLHL